MPCRQKQDQHACRCIMGSFLGSPLGPLVKQLEHAIIEQQHLHLPVCCTVFCSVHMVSEAVL